MVHFLLKITIFTKAKIRKRKTENQTQVLNVRHFLNILTRSKYRVCSACKSFGCYYNAEWKTERKTERNGKRNETENEIKVSKENKIYEFR